MELRVNDTEGLMLCEGGFWGDICGLNENECKKNVVLSVLFESVGCGGE